MGKRGGLLGVEFHLALANDILPVPAVVLQLLSSSQRFGQSLNVRISQIHNFFFRYGNQLPQVNVGIVFPTVRTSTPTIQDAFGSISIGVGTEGVVRVGNVSFRIVAGKIVLICPEELVVYQKIEQVFIRSIGDIGRFCITSVRFTNINLGTYVIQIPFAAVSFFKLENLVSFVFVQNSPSEHAVRHVNRSGHQFLVSTVCSVNKTVVTGYNRIGFKANSSVHQLSHSSTSFSVGGIVAKSPNGSKGISHSSCSFLAVLSRI